jgi:hypothetical protein
MLGILGGHAQERKIQHKPYIDLRPMHFGILVGAHLQDIEFENVGPQTLIDEEGNIHDYLIVTDADKWNPGFSVGVLGEIRLHENVALRFTPTMHFGAKHLTLRDLQQLSPEGVPTEVHQDMKNTYLSFPIDLKFSAQRWNNYRPYLIAGINQMINLTGKNQDYIRLKKSDTMIEIGMGCDLYLPFFKLIPEIKFCYSLIDALDKNHVNDLTDENKKMYARAVSGGHTKMIVLTFYFE